MTIGADDPSKGWILYVFCIVGLSIVATQCAPVLRGALTCEGVQVLSNELTVAEAEEYCRYAFRERKNVEGFWGTTWNEPIRINVSSSYRISRALVPGHFGNRGFMEMPLRRVRDNTGALLHEIVHIYAPKQPFHCRGPHSLPSYEASGESSVPQLRRGFTTLSCPQPVGSTIPGDIKQCADTATVEHCNE